MRIILDTNFLVYCAQNKIDFISELNRICDFKYSLFIIDKTIEELGKLKGKYKECAKLAKSMIKTFKIKEIKTEKDVDSSIIELCDENTIVATHDKELSKKLKCKIIKIRQKKYLIIK